MKSVEKIIKVSQSIVHLLTLLFIMLYWSNWKNAVFVFLPLLGVQCLLQAILSWKNKRAVAIICIVFGVSFLLLTAVMLLI